MTVRAWGAWWCRRVEYDEPELQRTIRAPSAKHAALKFVRWLHKFMAESPKYAEGYSYDAGVHNQDFEIHVVSCVDETTCLVTLTASFDIRFRVTGVTLDGAP